MSDIHYIQRFFTKTRSGRGNTRPFIQYYPFRTYSSIFHKKDDVSKFLKEMFTCEYEEKEKECSSYKNKLMEYEVKEIEHVLTWHAVKAEYRGKGRQQHDTVQKYLIKNDEKVIATEVPVFNSTLHGFIDILRIDNNKIQIVDFKPNAKSENKDKVCNQLYNYRSLVSQFIDINKIQCLYFDDETCHEITYT